jgi:hypothetical protein
MKWGINYVLKIINVLEEEMSNLGKGQWEGIPMGQEP